MPGPRAMPWLGAGVVLFLVVALGWVSDDAYVTLRSVDLTWRGYGPVFNVDERVQAYTHPLWFGVLLISYPLTGFQAWWAAFVPSVLATGAALALLVWGLREAPGRALLALALLGGSRAFLEYGTSGLENPLTFALLAGILAARARLSKGAALWAVSLFAGLAVVNRMDTALLVGPLWVATALQARSLGARRLLGAVAVGAAPLVAWEAFSLVYYGMPVPNTAYAKLGTGLPVLRKVQMGLTYLTHFALHDPMGAILLLGAALGGLLRGGAPARAPLVGIALYVAYIAWIGGDFMAGRFLAAPILLAAWTVARLPRPEGLRPRLVVGVAWALPALTVVWILVAPQRRAQLAALEADGPYQATRFLGIVDERAYFETTLGLPAVLQGGGTPDRITRTEGLKVAALARAAPGMVLTPAQAGVYGYHAGPDAIVVDLYGLGDPLVARLPMTTGPGRDWAPGHFPRRYPEGYLEGRPVRANTLEDPDLRAYYAILDRAVAGPVWSADRWRALWSLHAGGADAHLEAYTARLRARAER